MSCEQTSPRKTLENWTKFHSLWIRQTSNIHFEAPAAFLCEFEIALELYSRIEWFWMPTLHLPSVQTEAEFGPPAGAETPAHKLQGSPAGDEAPVTSEGPCYTGASGNYRRFEE